MLPMLGAGLGLAAAVGGGVAFRPELMAAISDAPSVAASAAPAASSVTANSGGDRATVVAGTNPVTGQSAGSGATGGGGKTSNQRIDRSILGLPTSPVSPSVQLPELVLNPPAAGKAGSIVTENRSEQFSHTAEWTAQPQVNGPSRHLAKRVAENSYVVVPAEAGRLHLLCNQSPISFYVDSSNGEWRVYRVDGGLNYDFSYRFVQYDRSPMATPTACQ
jgi:hypothetical protein